MEVNHTQETIDREIWDAGLSDGFTVKNQIITKDIIEDAIRRAYEKQQRIENFFPREVKQTLRAVRDLIGGVIDTVSPEVDEVTKMRAKKQDVSHAYIIGFTLACAEEALRLLVAGEGVPSSAKGYLSKHARQLEQTMAFGHPEVISVATGPVDPASYILDVGLRLEMSQYSDERRAELREKVGGPFASPPLPEIGDTLEATKLLRALQKRVFELIEEDLKKK